MSVTPRPRRLSLSRIKTKPKVLMSVAIPLVMTVIVSAIALINIERMKQTERLVVNSQRVLSSATDIVAAALEMETGMRGYLLAGQEPFLAPYEHGRAAVFGALTQLQDTLGQGPIQTSRLQEAEEILRQWQTQVAAPLIDLRRAMVDAPTSNAISVVVREGEANGHFEAFRRLMAEFSAAEKDIIATRQVENTATQAMTNWMIGMATIAALITGFAVAIVVGNNIGNGVTTLTETMKRLADGDNDIAISGQNRSDEVGDMARATQVFKQNAIEVASLYAEQEKANSEMRDMAAERDASAQRESELAREKDLADQQMAKSRDKMIEDLGKSFGTVVEAAIEGQFSNRVEASFEDQRLNELAKNINQLLSVVDQGLGGTGEALARVAKGDLTQPMTGEYQGAFGQLQINVNNMIGALTALIDDISDSGTTLAQSSAELRDTAGSLSSQTEQNAASLEETSAALEQLSASITLVGGNVTEASENAQTARKTAQSSEIVAAEAAASMGSIADASKEITRVVGVIDEIAFQINLLALNAGVEAARAGEAGRGFSVVASEVRQLSQRASEASKEIADVIAISDTAVSEGVEKVANAQSSLEDIAKSVISISTGVDSISTAIGEQVSGISEINLAVGQIDRNTQKQAAMFEEVTAASGLLAQEAGNLGNSTAQFTTRGQARVVSLRPAGDSIPNVAAKTPSNPSIATPRPKAAVSNGAATAMALDAQPSHAEWAEF